MNISFKIIILIIISQFIVLRVTGQIWPFLPGDDIYYDRVSCVFGEIHGSHFHEGIDIDDRDNDTEIRPIEDGVIYYIDKSEIHDCDIYIGHGAEIAPSIYPRVTILHECRIDPDRYEGESVFAGVTVIAKTEPGPQPQGYGHLHMEMWYRNGNDFFPVNPLNNDFNWELNLPGGGDAIDPQINNVYIKKYSNQPANILSGFNFNSISAVSDITVSGQHYLRVHYREIDNPSIDYDPAEDKINLWGSFSFVVNCRDRGMVNNANYLGSSGNGMTIKNAKFSIDNAPNSKYEIDFKQITHSERNLIDRIFGTEFNTQFGTDRLYGNDDYLKMFDLNATHIFPIRPINNNASNGIWFTKARDITNELFNTTPSTVARLNDESKYKDGPHIINFEAWDAVGSYTGNIELNVNVDNFRPYVKKVEIIANSIAGSRTVYNSEWVWNNGTLDLTPSNFNAASNGAYVNPFFPISDDVTINVTFSEPMLYQSANHPSPRLKITSPGFDYPDPQTGFTMIEGISTSAENTEFTWTVNHQYLDDAADMQIITLEGFDYAANPLMGLSGNTPSIAETALPVHQTSGSWLPAWTTTQDNTHRFLILQCGNGQGPNGTSGCLDADFITSDGRTTYGVNEPIDFLDQTMGLPTSWNWDFGDFMQTSTDQNPTAVSYSNPGIYTVALTADDGSETDIDEKVNYITVTGQSTGPISVTFSTLEASQNIYEGEHLTFIPDVQNADGNVTYLWQFPGGSPSTSSVQNPQVSYSSDDNSPYPVYLTVTDAGGNSDNFSIIGYVYVDEEPNSNMFGVELSGPTTTWINNSTLFTTNISNGIYPFTYEWDFGDGPVAGGPMVSHTFTSLGPRNITVTITDDDNSQCTKSLPIQVLGGSGVTCDFTPLNFSPDYHPAVVKFTPSAGNTCSPHFVCNWDFGDNLNATSHGTMPIYHTYNQGGPFTVQLTITDDCQGTGSMTHSIDIGYLTQPLQVGYIFDDCNDGLPEVSSDVLGGVPITEGQLTSDPNCPDPNVDQSYIYYWSVNNSFNLGIVNPMNIATYINTDPICPGGLPCTFLLKLRAVDDDGNTAIAEQDVTVYPDLEVNPINPSNTLTICPGGSTTYSPDVTGGTGLSTYKYYWIWPSTPYLTASCNNCPSPVITLTDPDQNGPFTATLKVSDNRLICPDVIHEFNIQGQPVSLDLGSDINACVSSDKEITGIVTGGSGNYTINWSPSLGLECSTCNSASQTFHINSSGANTFLATIHDLSGCSSSDNIIVNVSNDHPNIVLNDQYVCPGKPVSFSPIVTGGTGNYSYQWNIPPGHNSTLNFSSLQTTLIQLKVSDANGCSSAAAVYYFVDNMYSLKANAGSDIQYACYPDGKLLHGSASGGIGGYTYEWYHEYGNSIFSSDEGALSLPPGSTPDNYTLIVRDQDLCVSRVTIQVKEDRMTSTPIAKILSWDHSPANNYSYSCNVVDGIGAKTYDWTVNSTALQYFSAPYSMSGTISNKNSGFYYCKVTDEEGCSAVVKGTAIASLKEKDNLFISSEYNVCQNMVGNYTEARFTCDNPWALAPFKYGSDGNFYDGYSSPESFSSSWGYSGDPLLQYYLSSYTVAPCSSSPSAVVNFSGLPYYITVSLTDDYGCQFFNFQHHLEVEFTHYQLPMVASDYNSFHIQPNIPAFTLVQPFGPAELGNSGPIIYGTQRMNSFHFVGETFQYAGVNIEAPYLPENFLEVNNDGTDLTLLGEDILLQDNFWAKEGSNFTALLGCLDGSLGRFAGSEFDSSLFSMPKPMTQITNTLRCYPNPTMGSFDVEIKVEDGKQGKLSLKDLLGHTIKVIDAGILESKKYNLDLTTLGIIQGVYNISLETESRIYNQKVIFIQ